MDRDSIEEVVGFNLHIAQTMISAVEETWQLPRIWFANWWNVVVDSWWPQDFLSRD